MRATSKSGERYPRETKAATQSSVAAFCEMLLFVGAGVTVRDC